MEYRRLGKWGVKVSEISLGSWLTYGGSVEDDMSSKLIHHAFDNGINFFDTANIYYTGQAEEVVGKVLKGLRRSAIFLATKAFFPMDKGPNDRGLCRKHLFEQCHASLKRLQTDYIDLYQCHRPDPETPIEETVRAMDDLCTQGKILYWGTSEWSAANLADACHIAHDGHFHPPVSNQPLYNMLVRRIEGEVLPLCEREGLGLVVFSPLAQGVLTGKYVPGQAPPVGSRGADDKSNIFMQDLLADEVLEKVQRLKPIAEGLGMTLAQMALAWCLRQPQVSSVIVGATKLSQLDDNLKAVGVKLPPDALQAIDDVLGFGN
jgi:voltage-dependent potassium channel beta subunit